MILEPPPIYDFPYAGPVQEYRMTAAEIEKAFGKGVIAYTLAPKRHGDICVVFLPHDHPQMDRLKRHENRGHCNGWRH